MTDDNITFMFYTRTLSEDYRVFADDGTETLDYSEEFEPITESAEVESDDERSAVIFGDSGNVYVAAFGLMRGAKDRAGRDIRFSFCVILPESKRGAAMKIFSRVADEWDETGKAAGSLIKEFPVTRKDWKGRDVKGEDVRFDQRRFLQWLSSKPANDALPKAGYMLKYFADTGKKAQIPIGKGRKEEDEDISGLRGRGYVQPKRRNWLAISLCVVCVGLGILCFVLQKNSNEALQRATRTEETLRLLSDDLGHAREEISSLEERLSTVQASLDIERKEAEKWRTEVTRLKRQQGTATPPKR